MPPANPLKDYPAGHLIPGTVYKVLRHIATGGMGTVYDVEDTTVGKRYVLKTLHPELGDRQDLARRMIKEARMLAQLHHPNIVEVYTAGMTSDALRLPYYVMERLDGSSLRTVLEKRKSLELAHAYEIGIDLLDALDCAHDKQVIHRDVKPDNIFLHRAQNGATVTKLLDFGIMRVLDGAKGETQGRFLGTLRYAAPEQLRGDDIGPHTDLYAAGLVIYEMICGRGPFDEERDVHQIGKAHLSRAAPPLASYAKVAVPPDLERLIASSLAKDWRMRPRDAFTFAKELRALAQMLKAPMVPSVNPTSAPTAVNVLNVPSAAQVHIIVNGGPPPTAMGMTPPSAIGGTLQDAPPSAAAAANAHGVAHASTLASAGHTATQPTQAPPQQQQYPHQPQHSPPSAGPGVDRKAATRSLVYDQPGAAPLHGTEAITPPIAVTMSADPYGMTQQAMEAPPMPRPITEVPPISTQGNWQTDRSLPPPRLETTSPTERRKRNMILGVVATVFAGVVVGSLGFIAVRAQRQAKDGPPPASSPPPTVTAPPLATASPSAPAASAAAAPTPTPTTTATATATPTATATATPTATATATATPKTRPPPPPPPTPKKDPPPGPTPKPLPPSGL